MPHRRPAFLSPAQMQTNPSIMRIHGEADSPIPAEFESPAGDDLEVLWVSSIRGSFEKPHPTDFEGRGCGAIEGVEGQ
jgi:hypothetical protein